jgi:deoxyribodipyrimidine photolyase
MDADHNGQSPMDLNQRLQAFGGSVFIGLGQAWHTLYSCLQDRGKRYHYDMSKLALSQISCSRLSPYLAWGNISVHALLARYEPHQISHARYAG